MQGKCYRVEMVETDPQQLATASQGALNNMKFASQQVFTADRLENVRELLRKQTERSFLVTAGAYGRDLQVVEVWTAGNCIRSFV